MSIRTDPQKFSLIAKTAFAPVYPYLAEQIKNKFGINRGECLDAGSGPGWLAIAMAQITELKIISLDIQAEMSAIARDNIAKAKLESRISALTADVCRMPLDDDSIDLVVSRGSIFFWDNKVAAFREINRILKPEGVAYIGGGMGNEQIRAQVMAYFASHKELQDAEVPWQTMMAKGPCKLDPADLEAKLKQAEVTGIVVKENGGIWVEIHKDK